MNSRLCFLLFLFCPMLAAGQESFPESGKASYYAKKFHGRMTANGEIFNNNDYTAAHRTLPFNTYLNVTNLKNNFNIIVRVNDRGPYAKNRIIDLSEAAARRIGGYHHGLVPVRIEVLDIIQLTPGLDSAFHAGTFVDCLGNVSAPEGLSLSLWSTGDLLHAIYIANDLYLQDDRDVFIANTLKNGKRIYHVVITGLMGNRELAQAKEYYEKKGFTTVKVFKL